MIPHVNNTFIRKKVNIDTFPIPVTFCRDYTDDTSLTRTGDVRVYP